MEAVHDTEEISNLCELILITIEESRNWGESEIQERFAQKHFMSYLTSSMIESELPPPSSFTRKNLSTRRKGPAFPAGSESGNQSLPAAQAKKASSTHCLHDNPEQGGADNSAPSIYNELLHTLQTEPVSCPDMQSQCSLDGNLNSIL